MAQPIFMKDVDLILGDEATGPNFKCELKSVQLNPDTNTVKTKTLCPTGQYAEVEDPEWTLEIGYLNFDEATSEGGLTLADFLLDNKGQKVPFVFRPKAGGRGYKGTVTLVAGGFGGEQGNHSEGSVQLPLDGQPERIGAVVPDGADA